MNLTPQQQRLLLDAAREVIRRAARARGETLADEFPIPDPPDPLLLEPAGCFVSLHDLSSKRLRGCVGRLDAKHPIWHAVQLAAASVLQDPRFSQDPVRGDELARWRLRSRCSRLCAIASMCSTLSRCGTGFT
jgi:AMMECR1 domain-containing protein